MSEPGVIVVTPDQLRALIREEVEAALGVATREERLSLEACAARFGVTRQTIRAWCRTLGMPHRRTGKGYLFLRSEVEAWEAARGDGVRVATVHALRGSR